MSSQLSPSSNRTANSRPSSPSPELPPPSPHHIPEEDLPDLSPPSSPKPSVIASPPLDTRPYSPHGVGIGILSPQPVIGPFAPISRASLSPLHVKSSPVEQRSNPLDSVGSQRRSTSPYDHPPLRASGSRSPEIPHSSPPPPLSQRYVEDASSKDGDVGEHIPLTTLSSASVGQTGLRISIPPPNPTASTSTPSPPLLVPPLQDPVASSITSVLDPALPGVSAPASVVDPLAPPSDLNIDFTEFDTEGYTALEKVYLFSRSRASFHRVFIAHALPKYLLGAEVPATELSSREIIEQISPNEAVEYVLPVLNILAMDEDESVKEALAAELVPIIWWFVTHCRLVEDDAPLPPSPPPPSSHSPSISPGSEHLVLFPISSTSRLDVRFNDNDVAEPSSASVASEEPVTVVSVQAFTPILGTLLLSPNGIVSGSARYAVVELLRRLRRADQSDGILDSSDESTDPAQIEGGPRPSSPTPSQVEYQESEISHDVGFFQTYERRLFERELVYQVVIGMGHLDMEDNRLDQLTNNFGEVTSDSGVSTAVPTPQLVVLAPEGGDSYFPTTVALGLSVTPVSTMSAAIPPAPAAEQTTTMLPPDPSPSPPVSSASSLTGSPGHSSASTPSLTSSTSSSPGEYPDNAEMSDTDRLDHQLTGTLPAIEDTQDPMGVDELVAPEAKALGARNWLRPTSMPRQVALPTTPPLEVPPSPNVVAPVLVATESSLPISGLQNLQVQPPTGSPAARDMLPRQTAGWLSPRSAARELAVMEEQDDGSDLNEEAAVGRLSSMSLMAAVTASGSIGEDAKRAFVAEVERVGRDPVYWVRREASFAVGALAKVVAVEVVTSSLLPLFESLCHDSTWHVRHSVLFALPAILSRLTPEHRRKLALDVILPLSQDEESTVRSAVLEALGEVMYTFIADEGGPPEQLLKLFLGIRETGDPAISQTATGPGPPEVQPPPRSSFSVSATSSAWSDYGTDGSAGPDIYDDPQRPLVCAFNYPAITMTLGKHRWPELRPLYLSLVQDPSFKIRRTLAASLGEIAKITGEDHARMDLMDVFWSSLRAEESEVRMKVIETLQTFVQALGKPERAKVAQGLEDAFSSGKLSSWRERENAVKALGSLVEVEGIDGEVLRRMLMKSLDDRVAAVREAAVVVVPAFVNAWKGSPALLEVLRADIRGLASSSSFRKRTTYVTCKQEMLVSNQGDVAVRSGPFWEILAGLVHDPIVDVRIRVARLLGLISDKFGRLDSDIAAKTVALARDLAQDASHEVVAFAMAVLSGAPALKADPSRSPPAVVFPARVGKSAATFSRPPPPSPS